MNTGFQVYDIKGLSSVPVPAWGHFSREVNALTWEEAMRQGGLDWTVTKEQQKSVRTGYPIDSYGVYRDDTDTFLGAVGSIFTPIQNKEQFRFVDSLIESVDGAHYVAAGSIDGGEQVFCVAEIAAFDVASDGDKYKAFVVFRDYKNSKGSAEARVSLLREICTNGMHSCVAESALKFRHTTNVKRRMELAAESIGMIERSYNEIREKLETLGRRRFQDSRTVENVLAQLFPPTPSEIEHNRINNQRNENMLSVSQLFVDNDGGAFPDQSGTALALYHSVTNHVDHEKTMRRKDGYTETEARAFSSLFGTGADFKAKALDLILAETENLPTFERKYSFAGSNVLQMELEKVRTDKSLLDSIIDSTMDLAA